MQAKKGILNDILRFIVRKPEADQISKQGFAQFAIKCASFAGAGRKARKRDY
jgi:hypothetical protein